ncbi:MAG: SIS domain-containing protein [Actinomycetaceae bacterium]|nr:SIS domain-containing protein [Actinomycetaceae bacterium]
MGANVIEAAKIQILSEAKAVADVANQLDESFIEIAKLLLVCEGKVIVTGSGTSGATGRRLAHLLSVCGTPAVYLHPMDSLHGTMGAVTPKDVVIAISKGGESAEINQLCTILKSKGSTIIALTAEADSTLGRLSNVKAIVTTPEGADPGNTIAMGSTLVTSVWGDALAYVLMRLRKVPWEQMMSTHPGGAVGLRKDLPVALEPLSLE